MENAAASPPIKMTFSIPHELARSLDKERDKLATQLRTRLSMKQFDVRAIRLVLDERCDY